MELPAKIKSLYKHWNKHTQLPKSSIRTTVDQELLNEIIYLINERLSIYEKKENGSSKPFSHDPILNKYRFCNIYRELDRQTIFFHTILKPLESDFSLWLLNMLFCRSICKTETIEKIGLLSFAEGKNEEIYHSLLNLQSPKYGSAYIFPIGLIQRSHWNTREKFFCKFYPKIIPKLASEIQLFDSLSVVAALDKILPVFGFNLKFLLTEVLIDVAYQYPNLIDLYKQFPIGPGSQPTMKRLNPKTDPELINMSMTSYTDNRINLLTYDHRPVYLSAENWEGIGCEFRKYTNLKNGTGRKRLYS
jgi:hypothetical protein